MTTLQQLQKPGLVLTLLLTAHLSHGQIVDVDANNQNTGSFSGSPSGYGLRFGGWSSGEGIASKRNSGGNLFGLDFYTGFANRMSITNSGNVGIGTGTTAPSARLHVRGAGNAMPVTSGTAQSAGLISRFQTADDLVLDLGGNSTGGIWLQSALAGNLITNYALMLNPNGGNVGIGTTSPDRPLTLQGSGSGSELLSFKSSAGTTKWHWNLNSGGLNLVETAVADYRFFIKDGGNVGIGTSTPLTHLSISPMLTEAKITLWDGGISATHYGFGISANQLNYDVASVADSHVFFAGGKNGTGNELMRIKGNGNVGIGTPAPTAKLTVKTNGANALPATTGTTQATSQIARFQGIDDLVLDLGAYSTGGTWLQSTNATSLSTNYPLMLNPNGGNVGIGTTAPAAKLDVLGDTRLNGNVFIGSDMSKFTSPSTAMTDRKTTFGLWVAKGVVASDFAIATSGNWPDFVFAPGYRLAPLSETEAYIRQHGHLPEMPSAADVKKDGYSVHELNTRLLQKIEELTLHSIAQEKQIQANGQELTENRQQLSALQGQLRQYEALAEEVAHLKVLMEK